MNIKKLSASFMLCIFLFFLCSCSNLEPPKGVATNTQTPEIYFEASHGIDGFDVLTDSLSFNGDPIQLSYKFSNGYVASNYGLMLFLDGVLQPYYTDSDTEYKYMHIFRLEADAEETFQISFYPIATENKIAPLHLVAVYDADTAFESATLGIPFWQTPSQAYPATVELQSNTPEINSHDMAIDFNNAYDFIIDFLSEEAIPADSSQKNLTIEDNTNNLTFNREFNLHIVGRDEGSTIYRIYAFVNNEPVLVNGERWFDLEVESNMQYTMLGSIKKLSEKQLETETTFYLLAVPLHSVNENTNGVSILKSKSYLVT